MGKTRNLFKKIRDTKGTFHVKMGTRKDRNGMDLTEAEDTKRWQEYTELYRKCVNDPDSHEGVITHLETDILECEVKWALGSITTNKANGSKFGKLSSGHRAGKGQFSFQSQRKVMPKNVQTTTQLYSFHMLARSCSKSSKLGFNSMWTENFQMEKL